MFWLAVGLGALIGGIAGYASTDRERNRQLEEIRRAKQNALDAYNYGKTLSDTQYGIQKGEALWQIGMQDRGLREGMGQFTDEYNTHLLARAYGEQDARIQTASGIGASLAQEGMSGTRGNEANQLARDYAASSLEGQIDIQRKQDANALAGTVAGANRSITAMNHERASWDPGGHRYEAKTANDEYNRQMMEMGQANYRWQMQDINDNRFFDDFTGIFSGASAGMGMGKSLYDFGYNWWGKK
jgi:hypothetical protein